MLLSLPITIGHFAFLSAGMCATHSLNIPMGLSELLVNEEHGGNAGLLLKYRMLKDER